MNIGELSRLTGLPVKTIRYYSDVGLVPEAERSRANYRRYDHGSLVRLEFVRTLRELGLDIATIRQVLDRGADLASVAAAHAEAIGVQIRVLRLRRAALRAVARRDPALSPQSPQSLPSSQPASSTVLTPSMVERLTRLAQAGADERRRIVDEFFDSIFSDISDTPEAQKFSAGMRSVTADLPDDPTDEQVDAWIELAEMLREPDFRDRLREMGRHSFAPGSVPVIPRDMSDIDWFTGFVAEAMDRGVRPEDPAAAAVVAEVTGHWAQSAGRPDDAAFRREVRAALELGVEPRAERYWQLMAIINDWPPIPTTTHRWSWFLAALRAQ